MTSGVTSIDREVPYVQRIVDGQRLRAHQLHWVGRHAPTLAMIHGLEGSWESWQPLVRGCFERFNMFGLELPWDGQGGYEWCHTRPAHRWLALALEMMPSPPALLVAHSYGVNVALEYLERHGVGALQGLVLVSAFYRPDLGGNDWAVFNQCLDGFRAILEQGIAVRRGRELDPALLSTIVEKVLDHVGPVGFTECFSHFVRTPLLHLERITIPALVIAGEHDPGASPSGNAALAAALPAAQLALLAGCGHFCMIDEPDVFEETVQQFLMQRIPALERVIQPTGG